MNRTVKRAIKRHDKDITSLVRKVTIKRLKSLDIDYVSHGDNIVSTRNKDVERIYNEVMIEILALMNRYQGKFHIIKQIYN